MSVLGLGRMGRPIAVRLSGSGFEIAVWNRSGVPDQLPTDLCRCESLADAAAAAVCVLVLTDSMAVDGVLANLEPFLRPGQTVVDMGSSEPKSSRRHSARLASKGIGFVDAPMSGGPEAAAEGQLAIMVGGRLEDVRRVQTVLDALGQNVVHVGSSGSGHTAKLINQIIVGVTIEAVAEALSLTEKCGLNPQRVQEALRGGAADSLILQVVGARMLSRDYAPRASVSTMLKDLHMASDLARESGLRLPYLDETIARYERLVARGDQESDSAVLYKLLVD